MQTTRPVFLDLRKIRLPFSGYVSILHRISGYLLAAALPVAAYLLDLALSGPAGFAATAAFLAHPLVKLVLVGLTWSLLHHLFAGIRYLVLDLGIGLDRKPANRSALVAIIAALVAVALIYGGEFIL